MGQDLRITHRNEKFLTASNAAVTVPATGNTTLLNLIVEGIEKVSFQVDVATQALDAFTVTGRVHRDAPNQITIASTAAHFTAPSGRILKASGDLTTLAASASGSFDMDVSGLYDVTITASAAADSAAVSIYASGTSSGSANPNVTLTAGDIEIGAVELKNGADDTRAKVGAVSGLATSDNGVAAAALLLAGESHVGEVAGNLTSVSAEYTIVGGATAYSQYDRIGNNPLTLLELPNFFRKNGGTAYITKISLNINKKSLTPQIRVHAYNASDPTLSSDNAAWQDKYADCAKRLGWHDMPTCSTAADTTNSDTSRSLDKDLRWTVGAAANSRSLWLGFESIGAATVTFDAGQLLTVKVWGDNN